MKGRVALCLALSASLLMTACGGEPSGESIFREAAGLSPDAAALTVDGREVPAWRYLYWLTYACDYIAGLLWGEEIRWEDTVDGTDLEAYAREQALAGAALYATVENWAEDYGCVLTDEDSAAMDREWAARAGPIRQ